MASQRKTKEGTSHTKSIPTSVRRNIRNTTAYSNPISAPGNCIKSKRLHIDKLEQLWNHDIFHHNTSIGLLVYKTLIITGIVTVGVLTLFLITSIILTVISISKRVLKVCANKKKKTPVLIPRYQSKYKLPASDSDY